MDLGLWIAIGVVIAVIFVLGLCRVSARSDHIQELRPR